MPPQQILLSFSLLVTAVMLQQTWQVLTAHGTGPHIQLHVFWAGIFNDVEAGSHRI